MAKNSALNKAARAKKDEFYTQLSDIEEELRHYKTFFNGKVVLCNCDDPYESNFFKYFAMNFNTLGLKKLIATCYASSPVLCTEFNLYEEANGQLSFSPDKKISSTDNKKRPYRVEISEVKDENGDGRIDLSDVEFLMKNKKNVVTELEGDGDFRSVECIELLKQADVVVTNPPFSLFREYVAQLIEYKKAFLIIGNKNAIKYKEIFPLVMQNMLWIGYRNMNNDFWLEVPEGYTYEKIIDGKKMKHIMACWYTNIDIEKRHENLILYKSYSPKDYSSYINYNAIEVSKVSDIPCDYDGLMGVPITFMDKYNPDQFEIVGCSNVEGLLDGVSSIGQGWIDLYRSQGGRGHITANMKSLVGIDKCGKAVSYYTRFIIRNKHPQKAVSK